MLTDVQRETIFSRGPGPVTFVFPAPATTPRWLTGRFDSLAVRVTDHPLVVALCQAYGKPLVSTSANWIATLSNSRRSSRTIWRGVPGCAW